VWTRRLFCSSLGIDSSSIAAIVRAAGSVARASPFDARSTTTRLSGIPTVQRAAHTGASMTARGAFYLSKRSCPPAPEPHIVLDGYQLVGDSVKIATYRRRYSPIGSTDAIGRQTSELMVAVEAGSAAFVAVREIRQHKAVVKWLARQIQSRPR
jgi:hypothetical protein